MPRKKKQSDGDIVRDLGDCLGISDWEAEFIDSLWRRVIDNGKSLTPKQRKVAYNILNAYKEDSVEAKVIKDPLEEDKNPYIRPDVILGDG